MKPYCCLPVLIFVLSCKATQVPRSSFSDNTKCDYVLFFQFIDEGNNYGNVMNAVFKCTGVVEVQDNFHKNLFVNTKLVKVIFKDMVTNKMLELKSELQKCNGVIEVSATKL